MFAFPHALLCVWHNNYHHDGDDHIYGYDDGNDDDHHDHGVEDDDDDVRQFAGGCLRLLCRDAPVWHTAPHCNEDHHVHHHDHHHDHHLTFPQVNISL